jgi:outer membrane protein OmpA-like peptidoglycan-associated protein
MSHDESVRNGHGFLAALLVIVTILLPLPAIAQPEVAGARDFPLIKRYEGSRLIGYDVRSFDSFKLLLGKLKIDDNGQVALGPNKAVEGRHTRLLYLAPQGRSSLEVFRNYEADLAAKGFTVLFKCSGEEECEGGGTGLDRVLYSRTHALQNNALSQVAFNVPVEPRYLAASLSRPEGEVSVSLYVAREDGQAFPETKDRVAVLLDVVEAKPMEAKMVTVDAATMAKDIAATGKVALYGLYFDTDKAELKPESAPSLDEIGKLLKGQPTLKVYIVGHTDNVGGFDYNMGLSQRRAKSVVDRLIQGYGIAADRLKPVGAGMIAPVASNDEEAGRAKNRRVEIVKE